MQSGRLQFWDGIQIVAFICLFLSLLVPITSHAAPPPVITIQPLDQTIIYGGTANFIVTATSGTALSYQWYKDGLLIFDQLLPGETRNTLILTNVQNSDEGKYFVQVRNARGTRTSRKASLTVVNRTPPVAVNDTYTTPEDVPLIIPSPGILNNDTDADGDALSALLLTNVTNGSLSLHPDGSFTYTPSTNFNGTDRFAYRASDGFDPAVAILQQNNSGGDKTEIKDDKPGAQSFRHDSAGGPAYSVSKVRLRLSRKTSTPNVNLNFSIGTGKNAGPIAGSTFVITKASITNTSGGSSFQDYEIDYAAPVGPFTAGTTYYLNLDVAPTGKEVWIELSGNAYANGTYYEDGSNSGKDMRFQIHGITHSDIAAVTINVTPVSDPLHFTSHQNTANGFELQVSGPDASTYVISASANLTDWTPIYTNNVVWGNLTFTDLDAPNHPVRFYRVEAR